MQLKERILHDPDFRFATFGVFWNNSPMARFGTFDRAKIIVNFDNDPGMWGKLDYLGTITESPESVRACDVPIVIFSSRLHEIEKQLEEYGVERFYWAFYLNEKLPQPYYDAVPHWRKAIAENAPKIAAVRETLVDERSRGVYDAILAARQANDVYEWRNLVLGAFTEDQYFPSDVPLYLTEAESFVDAGAFTGDTIAPFIAKTGGKYANIYAFEPDPKNFAKLRAYCGSLPGITLFGEGLYSQDATLAFHDWGTHSSRFRIVPEEELVLLAEKGNVAKVRALDATIEGPVTYIKMDIEGLEPYALKGAAGIIKRQRPKLAICLYHHVTHLWSLPLYVRQLVPDYRFYIRHHSRHYNETVLYAI